MTDISEQSAALHRESIGHIKSIFRRAYDLRTVLGDEIDVLHQDSTREVPGAFEKFENLRNFVRFLDAFLDGRVAAIELGRVPQVSNFYPDR